MQVERTSVGLDVHARSVVACAIDGLTGEITKARLTPDHGDVVAWSKRLPGPVRVAYAAGPTGSDGVRAGHGAGGGGDRVCGRGPVEDQSSAWGPGVKTDARDAMPLARLRIGDLVAVRVPSREQEAARDLVRAREDARGDLMRVRHRLSKLLLLTQLLQLGRLGLSDTRLAALFDVGQLQPPLQAGRGDTEVLRDLRNRGIALTGDRDHIAAELLGERFRHDDILSARTAVLTNQESTKLGAVPFAAGISLKPVGSSGRQVRGTVVCSSSSSSRCWARAA